MKTVVIKKTNDGYIAIPKDATDFCLEHGDCLYDMHEKDWENYIRTNRDYHNFQNLLRKKRHEAALRVPNLKYDNAFKY